MDKDIYKPSLVCRLIGHKWWTTNKKERFDEDGVKHRDLIHTQRPFCERCGTKNPGFGV